jgi:hypothetical protein
MVKLIFETKKCLKQMPAQKQSLVMLDITEANSLYNCLG